MHLQTQSPSVVGPGSSQLWDAAVQTASLATHSPTCVHIAAFCAPGIPVALAMQLQVQSLVDVSALFGSTHACPALAQVAALSTHSSSSHAAAAPTLFPTRGDAQTHSQLSRDLAPLSGSLHVCPASVHTFALAPVHSSTSHLAGAATPVPTAGAIHLQTQSPAFIVSGSSHDWPLLKHCIALATHSPTSVHVAAEATPGVPVAGAIQAQVQSPLDASVLTGSSHACPAASQVAFFVVHSSISHVAAAATALPVSGARQTHFQLSGRALSSSWHFWPVVQVAALGMHSSTSHVAAPCMPEPTAGVMHSHTQSPAAIVFGSLHD